MYNFLTLDQIQNLADSNYVIFAKDNCRFYNTALTLLDELKNQKVIEDYTICILDKDFDNSTLAQLATNNGWLADGGQSYPSKPQIFMKGEYIGGNFEFYESKWNVGENMPNLKNPMRF